jgi:hypothetical protein
MEFVLFVLSLSERSSHEAPGYAVLNEPRDYVPYYNTD